MFSALLLPLALQVTQTPPIVKGTGLPLADSEEGRVMAPIDAMFAGLAARDGAAILAQTLPGGRATVVIEKDGGIAVTRQMSWNDFTADVKPGPERYEERLYGPAIEIDGSIAMVWARYTFFVDGKAHHCGTDHFDLLKENGKWKVLNVTWNQRTTGCEAP